MKSKLLLGQVGFVAIILVFSFTTAQANFVLGQYEEIKDSRYFEEYIYGVGNGFLIANSELRTKQQPQLYCQPDRLGLDGKNYLRILDDEIKFARSNNVNLSTNTPVELLLMIGLKRVFPCK